MLLADVKQQKSLVVVSLSDGRSVHGELELSDFETSLIVHATTDLAWNFRGPDSLAGRLMDGTRISFVQCHQRAGSETSSPEGPLFSAEFFPHFVAVGRCHLTTTTPIRRIHLRVQDAGSIFYDLDAFGTAPATPEQLAPIFAERDTPPQLGERPRIAFFSGRETIFSRDTVLGRVSTTNRLSYGMGGPDGAALSNRIFLSLEPPEPCSLDEMMDRAYALLRFLHVVAGRRQVMEELLAESADASVRPGDEFVELYLPTHRRDAMGTPASPYDIPLNGAAEPELFGDVLARWLELDRERWIARARFCNSVGRNDGYNADRLVAAANVFDILPKSALPPKATPNAEFAAALKAARAAFAGLPPSPERESALDTIGRINRTNLKRKVMHRAKIVLARAGASLPDFEWVLTEAVNARNFFVHGSSENRSEFFQRNQAFLTDALEFAFATSELIESGWQWTKWSKRGNTGSHPFGGFIGDYRARLDRLRRAAKAADASAT